MSCPPPRMHAGLTPMMPAKGSSQPVTCSPSAYRTRLRARLCKAGSVGVGCVSRDSPWKGLLQMGRLTAMEQVAPMCPKRGPFTLHFRQHSHLFKAFLYVNSFFPVTGVHSKRTFYAAIVRGGAFHLPQIDGTLSPNAMDTEPGAALSPRPARFL